LAILKAKGDHKTGRLIEIRGLSFSMSHSLHNSKEMKGMNKLGIFLTFFLSSCSMASDQSIHLPENETQRLIAQNLSLTTEKLYKAYMSVNLDQRRLAEMYVVGVIDSTEGISWCNYSIASPDAIQEQVFIGLKGTLKNNPEVRASTAIKSKLEQLLPCKEQK
jgi:hypothetical protein